MRSNLTIIDLHLLWKAYFLNAAHERYEPLYSDDWSTDRYSNLYKPDISDTGLFGIFTKQFCVKKSNLWIV